MEALPWGARFEEVRAFEGVDGGERYRDTLSSEFLVNHLSAPSSARPLPNDGLHDLTRERPG